MSYGGFPSLPAYTLGNRPPANSVPAGTRIRVSDIGSALVLVSDGTSWSPAGPCDVIVDLSPSASGVTSLSEQILKQYPLPIGLLRSCRYFSLKILWTKSGAIDPATLAVRLGTTGTTADPTIMTDAGFLAANRVRSIDVMMYPNSATVLRALTTARNANFTGLSGSSAFPLDATGIANMDTSALTLSLTATMGGTTDTPNVGHVIFTLY